MTQGFGTVGLELRISPAECQTCIRLVQCLISHHNLEDTRLERRERPPDDSTICSGRLAVETLELERFSSLLEQLAETSTLKVVRVTISAGRLKCVDCKHNKV